MVERVKFSSTTATKIKVPEKGEKVVWDSDVPSLGLRVRASGSKTWLVKKGADKWQLGRSTEVTIAEARIAAMRILSSIAAGVKPGKIAKPKVSDVLDMYMREHVAFRCKERTLAGYRLLLDQHILPRIGHHAADDISPLHIDLMMADMAHIKASANKALALIKAAFNKALRWGLRSPAKGNPAFGAVSHSIPPRVAYLTAAELTCVLDALEELSERRGRWHAAMCLSMLAVTGCRRDEMRLLQEAWIDWTGSEVHWPDTKTGAGNLILSGVAIDILRQVSTHKVQQDGRPWLFRGSDPSIPLPASTLYRTWAEALERVVVRYGVDPRRVEGLRPHDLRHSFASLAISSGLTLDDTRLLLRHASPRSTQRYAHHLPDRGRELALASIEFLQVSSRAAAAIDITQSSKTA